MPTATSRHRTASITSSSAPPIGVDPNVAVQLVIRAAQTSDPSRYVDQVLDLSIADIEQFTAIYEGNNLFTYYDASGWSHKEHLNAGFTYSFYQQRGSGGSYYTSGHPSNYNQQYLRIFRDYNGNQVQDPGDTLVTAFDKVYYNTWEPFNKPTTYTFLATGYRWVGTPWASNFLQELPPVVLDLNGDGRFAAAVAVSFDVDGDGTRDRVGWIDPGDAFLVLDRNEDGRIDHGAELSFMADLPGATSDLEGLVAYDSNADGVLDASDDRFGDFQVWQDANQDGVSDPGELKSLAEAGVASIALTRTRNASGDDEGGQALLGTSSVTLAGGDVVQLGDVALRWKSGVTPVPAGGRIAIDADGDGTIDPQAEAVGERLPLARFDSDGDGLITPLDKNYYELRLWTDGNGNGRADPDEIVGLDRAGLDAVSVAAAPVVSAATAAPQAPAAPAAPAASAAPAVPAVPAAVPASVAGPPAATLPAAAPAAPAASAVTEASTPLAPAASSSADAQAETAALSLSRHSFRGRSGRFEMLAEGGRAVIAEQGAATSAGAAGPASLLSFNDRTIGLIAPIVLDLDGDGVELRRRTKSRARHDMDGNGSADDTGWIGRDDGFLVVDLDGDGRIGGPAELGLMGLKPDAGSSLAALSALDSNRDERIGADDSRFAELRIWRDRNGNGATDAGELSSLAELGIASISLAAQSGSGRAAIGQNLMLSTTIFTRSDGSTGSAGVAALSFLPGSGSERSAARAPAAPVETPTSIWMESRLETLRDSLTASEDRIWNPDQPMLPDARSLSQVAAEASPAAALGQARVAQMVQDMAGFGVLTGENDLRDRAAGVQGRYDYFAA
jgi:hypothetical protein